MVLNSVCIAIHSCKQEDRFEAFDNIVQFIKLSETHYITAFYDSKIIIFVNYSELRAHNITAS